MIGSPLNGGQKLVFEANYSGEKCAVKAILISAEALGSVPGNDYSDDEAIARAEREVEILGGIDSPHLVSLGPVPFQVVEHQGQRIVIFSEEWLSGRALNEEIADQGPLPVEQVLEMALSVTSAICSLWDRSIVHRDIKPGNIVRRSPGGEHVLLDMGLAFDLGDKSITPSGIYVGTPIYYSPDQLILRPNRALDFRSDSYALGTVMYESLTGSHPFATQGSSQKEVVTKIVNGEMPVAPSSIVANVPNEVERLVNRLLQHRPHRRFRTCSQLEAELEAIKANI